MDNIKIAFRADPLVQLVQKTNFVGWLYGIDYEHASGFYAGVWASTLSGGNANYETDIYAGYSFSAGGFDFDHAIQAHLRRVHNIAVGERTAEEVKLAIGSAFQMPDEYKAEVRGRDLMSGLPRTVVLEPEEIRAAIDEPIPPGTVLNVNMPGNGTDQYQWTTLGRRLYEDDVAEREHVGAAAAVAAFSVWDLPVRTRFLPARAHSIRPPAMRPAASM